MSHTQTLTVVLGDDTSLIQIVDSRGNIIGTVEVENRPQSFGGDVQDCYELVGRSAYYYSDEARWQMVGRHSFHASSGVDYLVGQPS